MEKVGHKGESAIRRECERERMRVEGGKCERKGESARRRENVRGEGKKCEEKGERVSGMKGVGEEWGEWRVVERV